MMKNVMKNVVASLVALGIIFLMVLLTAATESLLTIITWTIITFVFVIGFLAFSRFSTNRS